MRQKMKYGWLVAIAFILVICVGAGIATWLSFTDVGADPDFGRALYWYGRSTPETLHDTPQEISEKSSVTARVRVTAERKSLDNCFATKVEVLDVYRGAPDLCGLTIIVYEPIAADYATLNEWRASEEKAKVVQSVLPGLSWDDPFISASPQTEAMMYHGPLEAGREYLLFLNAKEYVKESPKYGQTEEYNFADSVYALIPLSAEKEYAKPAPNVVTVDEATKYPVLLNSPADFELYMENRQKLLQTVVETMDSRATIG